MAHIYSLANLRLAGTVNIPRALPEGALGLGMRVRGLGIRFRGYAVGLRFRVLGLGARPAATKGAGPSCVWNLKSVDCSQKKLGFEQNREDPPGELQHGSGLRHMRCLASCLLPAHMANAGA